MVFPDLTHPQIRAAWAPAEGGCVTVNILSTKLTTITILITDITLLFIVLVGLLRLGFHESSVLGLGHLMWKQVRVSALLASHSISQLLIRFPFARVLFGFSLPPFPMYR